MRGVFASAVTAALTPLVTASSRPAPARSSGQSSHPASERAAAPRAHRPPESPAHRQDTEYPHATAYAQDLAFDEMYRGRRIIGFRTLAGRDADEWYVTVDGRPLHVMRRADGTWLTMVDHYRSYATPLEAARGAVDEMPPGSRLRDTGHGPWREEGHHGVHP
ncbi:MAG TPA: tyrosinase family oxidase copper chaperone [Streptomyces sp.]|nr:tyrosinase family oxidase copper chaperone [Streptomyces sp.]